MGQKPVNVDVCYRCKRVRCICGPFPNPNPNPNPNPKEAE